MIKLLIHKKYVSHVIQIAFLVDVLNQKTHKNVLNAKMHQNI
jgi:hypothetical protein